MTPVFDYSNLSLEGNTLSVNGKTLGWGDREIFSAALKEFIGTDQPELVLDLSRVEYMSSSFLGPIAAAMMAASEKGCQVTILAAKRTAFLLETSGVSEYAQVSVIPD